MLAVLLLGFIVLGMMGFVGLAAARMFWHSAATEVTLPDPEGFYVMDLGDGPPEEPKSGTEAIRREYLDRLESDADFREAVEQHERNGNP